MIKGYHTKNGILNTSDFMEEILNNHKKIIFSLAGASHQNGAAERAINMVFTMAMTMLMYAELRCPKDILSTDFFQW